MIAYAVNLELDAAPRDAYMAWLRGMCELTRDQTFKSTVGD